MPSEVVIQDLVRFRAQVVHLLHRGNAQRDVISAVVTARLPSLLDFAMSQLLVLLRGLAYSASISPRASTLGVVLLV